MASVAVMALAGLLLGLLCVAGPTQAFAAGKQLTQVASVKVEDAWVRATMKGQTASGGFMSLTASQDLTLVGFTTPAASDTELHEMAVEGGVMRMRAVDSLPLPAGRPVVLKPGPGGQHLMLMGLKQPLLGGKDIPLTLKLRTASGKLFKQVIQVPVRAGLQAASQPRGHKGTDAASAVAPHSHSQAHTQPQSHSHDGHDHAH